MFLRGDFNERHVVHTHDMDWVDSPITGVRRKMLDRIGDEVARATSIVRYASNSSFEEHCHELGEEFLVLEGTFSDELGDYPTGTYVRNPPGSRHRPFSKDGCTIFVKLRQFATDDMSRVVIDTRSTSWRPGLIDGLHVMPLHSHGVESVALVRWDADARFHRHAHPGGEEILVLRGTFEDEQGTYETGVWLRNPPHSIHQPFTRQGCTLYVKTGHLG